MTALTVGWHVWLCMYYTRFARLVESAVASVSETQLGRCEERTAVWLMFGALKAVVSRKWWLVTRVMRA